MIAIESAARIENKVLLFNVKHSSTGRCVLPLRGPALPQKPGLAHPEVSACHLRNCTGHGTLGFAE
jgi:hypothetical protein